MFSQLCLYMSSNWVKFDMIKKKFYSKIKITVSTFLEPHQYPHHTDTVPNGSSHNKRFPKLQSWLHYARDGNLEIFPFPQSEAKLENMNANQKSFFFSFGRKEFFFSSFFNEPKIFRHPPPLWGSQQSIYIFLIMKYLQPFSDWLS